MESKWIHLKALFAWMPPERLLDNIRASEKHRGGVLRAMPQEAIIHADRVAQELYVRCVQPHRNNLSEEELRGLYSHLVQNLEQEREGSALERPCLFTLLVSCARELLTLDGTEPLCRHEHVLDWRWCSFELGQDVLTCAFVASEDARTNYARRYFTWPPLLRTDELSLRHILERGMSENHFHLNGSTQSFPITWGYLMNHPARIRSYFSHPSFRENLHVRSYWGVADGQLPWEQRMYYAAWLRAVLFGFATRRENESGPFAEFDARWDKKQCVCRFVERLRQSGARFEQPNGSRKCLDYAITPEIWDKNRDEYRFLAGERVLLYRCFQDIFSGRMPPHVQDLLYLYLLLKQQLHNELIQTNDHTGFRNFSNYQDRKDMQWPDMGEYLGEARRMAVNAAHREHIQSLEMRITPSASIAKLRSKISDNDWFVACAQRDIEGIRPAHCSRREAEKKAMSSPAFYAVHFIKEPNPPFDAAVSKLRTLPRNWELRRKAEKQARTLRIAIAEDAYLRGRIRAIDAASFEIGCRPEALATEFRYLREGIPPSSGEEQVHLRVTYHVGEDFLDLADGLRAIDEAVCFLNLRRGDRIGHALAMGVAPEIHYEFKHGESWLPAQDLLDNLIWILSRCEQWGIPIPVECRIKLQNQADHLLREIYHVSYGEYGEAYHRAWLLRGDHPGLYRGAGGEDRSASLRLALLRCTQRTPNRSYSWFKVNREETLALEQLRRDERVLELVFRYHYGREERIAGEKVIRFDVDPLYARLMRAIQDKMIEKLSERGLSIEANPTSNVLIGTFRRYDLHPIFRFNHHGLSLPMEEKPQQQIRVSVNTDDQGVFDTSLEFEYALLMRSLQERRNAEDCRILTDDEILSYLEHLRIMGNEMAFLPVGQSESRPETK